MTRLERRYRTDIVFKTEGSLADAFDNALKEGWRINDEEYNLICDNLTEEENNLILLGGDGDFSQKRRILNIINKLLETR